MVSWSSQDVICSRRCVVLIKAEQDTWQSDISVRRWQKKELVQELPDDIGFTAQLLNDLDTVLCFDTDKVHAVGLGTGAGMVHLMACDQQLSTRIASFATVAGGFGHPSKGAPWKSCTPARLPIPMLSIHGDDDKVLPYLLNEWEPAKSRLAVPTWLEDWTERNGCGEAVSDPLEATDGTGTEVKVTKLDGGGWSSEGDAFNGGALRIAKSCPRNNKQRPNINIPDAVKEEDKLHQTPDDDKDDQGNEEEVIKANGPSKQKMKEEILSSSPKDFTILHYRIRGYGHGWPTLQIKGSKPSKVQERFFDATALVLDWFKIHELPIEWAGSEEATKAEKSRKDNKEKPKDAAKEEVKDRKKEGGETDKVPMGLTEDGEGDAVDDVEGEGEASIKEKDEL
jgi:poly(3-hydroxybutyrate) depolymerase